MKKDNTPKTRTYLDTCVLIWAFRAKDDLAEKAFQIIDDPNREFVASDFLNLELLPKPTYNNQKEELGFYNQFIADTAEYLKLSDSLLSKALHLACQHGLGPIDALHLQAAIELKANEFITNELSTKPFFRVSHQELKIISLKEQKP
jgi:predicted nucleic acid-binding protein